ncbi:hypothetical protein EVB79_048 [Rhizobium phage RHph_N3_13]|nr:hypothetical protein EVB79_048 [Rhizobium phage RHph_N3_13]QIG69874.1 hypothetical protein F67_I3_11_048 [Rhizobium phage RHph_I3_11]
MIFKVGDIVTSTKWPDMGEGEIVAILNETQLAVRFKDYEDYSDDDAGSFDWPELPDFHYVQVEAAQHVVVSFNYNPEQTGDREDDI